MNKFTLTSLVIAALTIGAQAQAQGAMGGGERGERPQRPDFATLDTDTDGFLSVEEIGAMENVPNLENFMGRMDADSDGQLTEEEYTS